MPHVVTQACCADASCVIACPVNCIHPAPGEPGFGTTEMLFIDPASCVGCGACVTACPVGAIVPDNALSLAQLPFAAINSEYFAQNPHPNRSPVALVPTQRRLHKPGPFTVAVIGSGPAGLYTADALLEHPEITGVDVFDRLLTPHGLVRHGVAPDHAATKQVTKLFEAIEDQPGFRYVLGVEVGRDVTLSELRGKYDAVVYAVGASSDRSLGIPGEDLTGSIAATEVVGWYNGHPDNETLTVPLQHERAVVIGNGNVALDVARILTRDVSWLETHTDIAPGALKQLQHSMLREVVVIGRRGPADAAFTMPELIGLSELVDVDVIVEAEPALFTGTDQSSALLGELARRTLTPGSDRRRIVLRFALSPMEILGTDGRVTGIRVRHNELVTGADGVVTAVPSGSEITMETGLVIRSIGHRGLPVTDLPFDQTTGTVPNDEGRVEPGLYVAGWIKRGPRGFIGTNKTCARQTVDRIIDDLDGDLDGAHASTTSVSELPVLAEAVDLAGWRRLDVAEKSRGRAAQRPRVKITDPIEQRQLEKSVPVHRPARRGLWSRSS